MITPKDIAEWLRARPARAGGARVLGVEGRSGAGKTTLARAVAAELGAPLVAMDELYAGWDGLLAGVTALHDWVLEPLAGGQPVRWRRWDWSEDRYGGWHDLPSTRVLVIEGVGCGARALSAYLSGLIWVEAPAELRRERALRRDGDTYAPHWERWARQEDLFHSGEQVRARADLIADGSR